MRYGRLYGSAVVGAIVGFILGLVPVMFVSTFAPLVGGFVAGYVQGGGRPSAWAGLLSGAFLFILHTGMVPFAWLLLSIFWYIGFSGFGGMLGGMMHDRRGQPHEAFVP